MFYSYRYNDRTICRGALSMLIYYWEASLLGTTFQITNGKINSIIHVIIIVYVYEIVDPGFQIDKSKSVVLTVTYVQKPYVHRKPPGVVLHISTLTYV